MALRGGRSTSFRRGEERDGNKAGSRAAAFALLCSLTLLAARSPALRPRNTCGQIPWTQRHHIWQAVQAPNACSALPARPQSGSAWKGRMPSLSFRSGGTKPALATPHMYFFTRFLPSFFDVSDQPTGIYIFLKTKIPTLWSVTVDIVEVVLCNYF